MWSNKLIAKENPPRVLHLIHWLNPGGIESWLLAALRHMPREVFAMDVCYKGPREGDLAPNARAAGAELLHCPLGPTVLPFIRRLKKILVEGKYSLLHVHTHAHSGPAVYAANAVGLPVVVTFHSTEQPAETRLTRLPGIRSTRRFYAHRSMRYALRRATASNGVSRAVVAAVERTAGVARSSCKVFYLGCPQPREISADQAAAYRKEFGLGEHSRVIVHVGSFRACKNHAGILRVFRRVFEAVPSARLLLVGDGPLRPAIWEKALSLGIGQQVRLLGNRRDATSIMQLGDALLFPSLYEGLSISLMEAGAVGLPIVASNIPGNREGTDNGASARLHAVTDEDGMAASLIDLLQNPAERRRLSECGRRTYQQTFSMQASIQRLAALYKQTMQDPQSTCAASTAAA